MNRSIRENIIADYCLHDMNVTELSLCENKLIMKTQNGIVKVRPVCEQVNGYVEFNNVDYDFSFVYLFEHNGNVGKFSGEKMMLSDFIKEYKSFGFSVIDEVYGYNQTKYMGYLTSNRKFYECIIEIYHLGDMIFVEEE